MAQRTLRRSRHLDDLVDAFRFGPLPGWMAMGSAAFFALDRRAAGGGHRSFAAFELAAVQGIELGLKLLILSLQLEIVRVGLVQLLVEFLELVFVLALHCATLLIAIPNPLRGQAFQIGTAIPVRADERLIQLAEAGHRQSSGNWSNRQLTSESRTSSWRTLRWLRVMARTRGTSSWRTYLVTVFCWILLVR